MWLTKEEDIRFQGHYFVRQRNKDAATTVVYIDDDFYVHEIGSKYSSPMREWFETNIVPEGYEFKAVDMPRD